MKLLFVPTDRAPRTIKSGVFRGLRMELDLTSQTQLYLGLFERELHKWINRFSMNIKTVIDIGAGEGEYTLYFLTKSPAEKVLAFEPLTTSRTRLMRNLELNGAAPNSRLVLSSKFVGAMDRDNCQTLDSLSSVISPPCLIKIDVEGGEVDVLRGATTLLSSLQTSWIVETHSRQLEEECITIFSQTGFATTVVPNAWWRWVLPEFRPLPHNRWFDLWLKPYCEKPRQN